MAPTARTAFTACQPAEVVGAVAVKFVGGLVQVVEQ